MTGWELVRAAQGGDRDAFAEFYRRYRRLVLSDLRLRGVHDSDIDDVASEVFLRAWRSLHTVTEQRDDPSAWLVTIARNLVIDRARSAARKPADLVAEIPEPTYADERPGRVAASAEPVALERIDRAATTAQVRSLVAGLRPDYRQSLAALHGRTQPRRGSRSDRLHTRRVQDPPRPGAARGSRRAGRRIDAGLRRCGMTDEPARELLRAGLGSGDDGESGSSKTSITAPPSP